MVAIILHRFTPVRDGWTRNEVWDSRAHLFAPYSFLDVLWADVSPVCITCRW